MRGLQFFLLPFLLIVFLEIHAQEIFIIRGDTLELQREVKGELSLLWTSSGSNHRFFVQKGKKLVELKNSINEETNRRVYREQLENLTSDAEISTLGLSFLLYDLKHFVNQYNAKVTEDYVYNTSTPNLTKRIGLFIGFSNNKYTYNPQNILAPVIGIEFEIYDPNLARRHSAFIHLRQSFNQDEYQYTSTQLSLNYRFRFLYFRTFNLHLDTELATLLYSREKRILRNSTGAFTDVIEESGFSFTAPLSFGIGSEIRLSEDSFLTLSYNDIVSIVLDGNGNFPLDFTLGYKYNL
ncbi:MAG TPA: hypothetical protein VFM60_01585 [Salinimicrobium sp.]|nr:hypothetical protein [Salinimicrobium sp.]